jgi:hypothetical protein
MTYVRLALLRAARNELHGTEMSQPQSLICRNFAFSDDHSIAQPALLFLALFKTFSFALSFLDARANRKYG